MIKLKDVVKYYTSDANVTLALKNINLEFYKGEFVAITGKSGSGKSTLLNVLSGMDTYEEGEMYFKGQETSYYDNADWEDYRRNNISFIYQSYNLIDSYTALENVETVMAICGEAQDRQAQKKRRRKALDILDKVGLKKWAGHKAVHLSSGQKQRLGIARALAKETDVIIADEPTGNLDAENGAAVMKMLYELSKDRLVIVVTHNFEQVESYASRKIRLFDGEVAEDTILKPDLYEDGIFKEQQNEDVSDQPLQEGGEKRGEFKKAVHFVVQNRRAQPHRTFFIFSILTVTIASFFIMYGYFLSDLDDTKTREISDKIFNNVEDTRVIVRKPDGSVLSEEDIRKLNDISFVSYVNPYDYAGEISSLLIKDTDYKVVYKKTEGTQRKSVSVQAENYENYMKCAGALEEKDLSAGRLPEGMYEVVIPSKDKSLIGTTMDIYFASKKWTDSTYLGGTFTITGILGEEYHNAYFTDQFMKSLNVNYGDIDVRLDYVIRSRHVSNDTGEEDNVLDSEKSSRVILVAGEGLEGNQIRISSAITINLSVDGKEGANNKTIYENVQTAASLKNTTDQDHEIVYETEIAGDTHDGSGNVVEVSHELLEKIYGSTDITQVSVIMEDYAYTDRVIEKINGLGFEAISPYRVSAGEYNPELVQEQLHTLLLSAGAMVVIFILSILVIYSMMKLKRRDFVILKSLGMRQRIINEMNYYELITGTLGITILLGGFAVCSNSLGVKAVADLVKYYRAADYVFVAVLAVCMAVITAKLFNRHLGKALGGRR